MKLRWRVLVLAALAAAAAVGTASDESVRGREAPSWRQVLARRLPLYGHRNWVVIADSAYPAQSKPGIETVLTGASQLEVVEEALAQIDKCKHLRPNVYLDAELPYVEEGDARGVTRYRERLKRLLGRRSVSELPHEKIIDRLDSASGKFHVLVLKTEMTLPYTSVFLELDCGYWGAAAEKRLREALKKPREAP
jgi:hypothetical protein